MRNKKADLNVDLQKKTLRVLWEAAETADKHGATIGFLKNLLTESEQLMLGRRLLIARMLLSGLPQKEIMNRLRVSPNTIWKVNKWLVEQIPEYGEALKKVDAESKERAAKSTKPSYHRYQPLSFSALKRKYPMHFLLFNVVDKILERTKK